MWAPLAKAGGPWYYLFLFFHCCISSSCCTLGAQEIFVERMKHSRRFTWTYPYWKGCIETSNHMQMNYRAVRPTILGNQLKQPPPYLRSSNQTFTYLFWQYSGFSHYKSMAKKKKIMKKQIIPSWFWSAKSESYLECSLYLGTYRSRGEFHFDRFLKYRMSA